MVRVVEPDVMQRAIPFEPIDPRQYLLWRCLGDGLLVLGTMFEVRIPCAETEYPLLVSTTEVHRRR